MTAFQVAGRFSGYSEVAGVTANPMILAMLRLDGEWPVDDSVPWCSAFVNFIAWLLDLPRSKSLAARSWLKVGVPVGIADAQVGFDVVILKRGSGPQPGPEVLNAQGHVGFFAGRDGQFIEVLGGNQSNAVTRQKFPLAQVLGVRRLA